MPQSWVWGIKVPVPSSLCAGGDRDSWRSPSVQSQMRQTDSSLAHEESHRCSLSQPMCFHERDTGLVRPSLLWVIARCRGSAYLWKSDSHSRSRCGWAPEAGGSLHIFGIMLCEFSCISGVYLIGFKIRKNIYSAVLLEYETP